MVTLLLVFAIAFALSFTPLAFIFVRNYVRFRRPTAVTCPETGAAATVGVEAGRAAFTSAVRDEPRVRISSCSNWPQHEGCCRDCGEKVESSLASNFR